MLHQKKICVILPAYNAKATLGKTYGEIPFDCVDEVVLVDDGSQDGTEEMARELGIQHVWRHPQNKGYGANQKTCYQAALALDADIIIMLHPDYQYTPRLIESMASLIANDVYPVVLGSRILGRGAIIGGMPMYKYFFNRVLTFVQNVLMHQKLAEYHTGYRAFSRQVLERIHFMENSDDFVFDNQMLAQIFYAGFQVAEISCPTKYEADSSSINFRRSVIYGLGVLRTAFEYRLQKWGILHTHYLK